MTGTTILVLQTPNATLFFQVCANGWKAKTGYWLLHRSWHWQIHFPV